MVNLVRLCIAALVIILVGVVSRTEPIASADFSIPDSDTIGAHGKRTGSSAATLQKIDRAKSAPPPPLFGGAKAPNACASGRLSNLTQDAMERFKELANAKLPTHEPDIVLLSLVTSFARDTGAGLAQEPD